MSRDRQDRKWTRGLTCVGVVIGLSWLEGSYPPHVANAQTLVYSFEFDEEGFSPNGGGITLAQDTIGATEGEHSLKISVVGGATFVGALTQFLPPEIGDPPGMTYVLFDLTIDEAFAGSYSVVGVTMFGSSQPDYPGGQQFGLQAQFFNESRIDILAPGTYHNLRIGLELATHPLTFEPGSFNDIFGTIGSGENDVIPGGFQFFINKSNDAPLDMYIDNVRVGSAPSGDFDGDGDYDCSDINALTTAVAQGSPIAPFDLNSDGVLSLGDVDVWRGEAGNQNIGRGRSYLPGDANLSGAVDGSDFGIWNASKFTNTSNWCDGDFNASSAVDGSDFGIWNANKFTSSDGMVASVPEPMGLCALVGGLVLGLAARSSRSRRGLSITDRI